LSLFNTFDKLRADISCRVEPWRPIERQMRGGGWVHYLLAAYNRSIIEPGGESVRKGYALEKNFITWKIIRDQSGGFHVAEYRALLGSDGY
jgi:hypothetical protein